MRWVGGALVVALFFCACASFDPEDDAAPGADGGPPGAVVDDASALDAAASPETSTPSDAGPVAFACGPPVRPALDAQPSGWSPFAIGSGEPIRYDGGISLGGAIPAPTMVAKISASPAGRSYLELVASTGRLASLQVSYELAMPFARRSASVGCTTSLTKGPRLEDEARFGIEIDDSATYRASGGLYHGDVIDKPMSPAALPAAPQKTAWSAVVLQLTPTGAGVDTTLAVGAPNGITYPNELPALAYDGFRIRCGVYEAQGVSGTAYVEVLVRNLAIACTTSP